jgi:ribosomal-protein-alanine N-acetyltransferase
VLTARLRLRPLAEDDLDELYRLYRDPLVEPWIGHHTREALAEELGFHLAHQAEHGWAVWAVEERATNRFIGDCGLQPLERRGPEVELTYELYPDAWGRGYATEAARAVVHAALGTLALDSVVAVVKAHNLASRRVLEKAGLSPAGERVAYGERMLLYEISGRASG